MLVHLFYVCPGFVSDRPTGTSILWEKRGLGIHPLSLLFWGSLPLHTPSSWRRAREYVGFVQHDLRRYAQRRTAPDSAGQRRTANSRIDRFEPHLGVKTASQVVPRNTFCLKKKPIEETTFFGIVVPSIRFFLSSKLTFKIADWTQKCAWQIFYFGEIDPAIGPEGNVTFPMGPSLRFGMFRSVLFFLPGALFAHIGHFKWVLWWQKEPYARVHYAKKYRPFYKSLFQ